jgi:4-amino-4-deoxy-L-arabinose transferase-like glycosyltransferase
MKHAAAVFAASFGIYLSTLAPTVVGEARNSRARPTIASPRRADQHPLHAAIGRVFGWLLPGEPAWTLNVLSATFGALTVMLVFLIAARLARTPRAGWLAAAALCCSHTFWQHAVIAEVYTLNAFFAAALIWIAIVWYDRDQPPALLLALAGVGLVGLTNHLVLASIIPPLLL